MLSGFAQKIQGTVTASAGTKTLGKISLSQRVDSMRLPFIKRCCTKLTTVSFWGKVIRMTIEDFRGRLRTAADEALRQGFFKTHQALLELLVSMEYEAQQAILTQCRRDETIQSVQSGREFRLH